MPGTFAQLHSGNLFAATAQAKSGEQVTELALMDGVRIERIVSLAHVSPPGFWYDQDGPEWVVVLSGAATLQLAAEPQPRHLRAGDYLFIPAHQRHRVEWTDPAGPTVWLAVHGRPALVAPSAPAAAGG